LIRAFRQGKGDKSINFYPFFTLFKLHDINAFGGKFHPQALTRFREKVE
jgi:hypothetical protein